MRILVVDDSTTMRRILINTLKGAGVTEVDEACDGQQAVDAVTATQYGLVLMDWNMPNLLGIEALKAIRALGNTVPVIMVTTEAEKGRVLEALKAGASNYIIKPFTPAVIMEKVNAVLGKSGASIAVKA